MSKTLTMSKKEVKRISILQHLTDGNLTHAETSRTLGVSERHSYRLAAAFRARGADGIVHKLRGGHSNHCHAPCLRAQVLALYRQKYADYGPTLFCEALERWHQIVLNRETARQWLTADGQWTASTKKHPHRRKRPRRKAIGELVQLDGSSHKWFEDRAAACTLVHMVDDASNRTFLRFGTSENTRDVMLTVRAYIERYGIPRALYVDYGSVFKDGETPTQFERAMSDLGVEIIHAHSPQAKGRVERGNRTHQDRLIKHMRQAEVSGIDAANAFVDREYLDDHNARFATTDGLPDVHRSAAGIDLDKIFCFKDTRVVANDYTIQLDAHYIQLLRSETPLPPPRQRVVVRQFLDGSLHLYWNEQELAFTHLAERPRKAKRASRPLPASHAWREQNARLRPRRRSKRARIMTPP